jgi:hypothetical protein
MNQTTGWQQSLPLVVEALASTHCFEQVCEIAKSMGATKIQALAKPAAARLYRRAGLVEQAILMEKRLWVE